MNETLDLDPHGIDARTFRHVVGHLTSGVTVVTTDCEGERFGMTASSVTSLSADPPLMLACLNNSVPTADAVSRSGRYAVNVLGQGHGDLAHTFAMPSPDKFAGVAVTRGSTGSPLISDALAHIECEVAERVVGGTHTIFIGRVVSATAYDGEPLTYFRGGFGRFEFARDDAVYTHARERILDRVHRAGDVVDVDQLAEQLEVDQTAVFYALTRLTGDGLVRRDPERGYVVTAFDASASDATFEARLAIEIGVLEQVIGRVPPEDLAAVRRDFDAMSALLVGERFVDFDAYLDANYAFHERLVGLAHNPVLDATFGTLSIKQVMTRSFGSTPVTSQRFIEAQRGITEGLEGADRERALSAAREYTDLAKERVREILQQTGGQL
ncbi:flavin reductase [Nocardioides nanhaiensis]|uniref:HTH gntR-type domain-containing protein n=1 Tax=Nocardioides nanhaiensis TaxID=1476871 RepID=A0ABP8W4I8_9ACTN